MINQNRETQKLLRDENAVLKATIQKLKEEVKQIEMEKSKSESLRADVEYNYRASVYNTETLNNKIEFMSSEVAALKKQSEKQKNTIEVMMETNKRQSFDLDHYKKMSLHGGKKKSNVNGGNSTPLN